MRDNSKVSRGGFYKLTDREMIGIRIGDNSWLSGNPLEGITNLMDVWYDGTVSGGQLIDKSGNLRHATVTSNLITRANSTLGITGFFQSGGTAPTVNSIITNDLAPGGTETLRFRWESVASFFLHRTHGFVLKAGESVTISFWAKKVTNSAFTWVIRMADGATNGISSTLSAATYLVSGSQAVGSWGRYQATFTNTVGGGLAHFFLNGAAGTHEVLIGSDISVTVSGVNNTCFIMPSVTDLRNDDTLNHFYTSAGLPLTTRGDAQYNAYVKRIFCGGAMEYIFLKADPSINTYKILHDNFIDNDHAFDSCPIELFVGTGQTYTLPQSAINASTGTADFRHRRRIVIKNDLTVSTYAEYTVVSGGGFQAYIQMNKFFDYFTSDSGTRRKITFSKEISASDAQLGGTEPVAPQRTGGWRGIDMDVMRGGYKWHQDFSSMANGKFIIKDCVIQDLGADDVYAYRLANALPAPAGVLSFNIHAGGMHNGFIEVMDNVTLRGNIPYTWQDVACTSGNGGNCYINDCVFDNIALYDAIANSTTTILEAIRLTSSGGGRVTNIFLMNTPLKSTVNKVGASESLFLTQI